MSTDRPTTGDDSQLAERLERWLGERVGAPGAVSCDFAGPVPTGNSNVTMPFTARWPGSSLDLVLRMQVPGNRIFLDADVLREHRILAALAEIDDVPAPRPLWAESDPSVLGQPFFVMERVTGTVPTGAPSIHAAGWLAERTPDERAVAWDAALRAIGAVHAVGWQEHLAFLADGVHGASLHSRLDHASTWYEWAKQDREYPITDAAFEYLVSNVPATTGPPSLLWGDARWGNLMFDGRCQVAAVLDWELASIGPAAIDLGWWLAFDEFTTDAHGIAPLRSYPSRAATIERYEELTGTSVADPDWYEIYCAWVLTVTVIRMADIGVAAGRIPPDNRMGEGNLTAQMLARRLDLPVPDLDRHYAARRGLPVRGPAT
jgi:aminoglycoside phosphotransferase (APT) family kinase protein